MRIIRRLLVGLLATVGFLTILAVALGGVGAWWLTSHWREERALPERMILTIDLRQPLGATPDIEKLLQLDLEPAPTRADLVLALERAATDPRVAGLVAILGETDHGFAAAQELRDSVRRFSEAGKFTIAWADSFGELGPANEGYYLATAFDQVLLQPMGLVGLTGLAAEQPYAQALLGRLGIDMQVLRRSEYKSAFEPLTERRMPAPSREMLETIVTDLQQQIVHGIATARELDPEQVAQMLGQGPFLAEQAQAMRLVDGLAYREDALALGQSRAGAGARAVNLGDYGRELPPPVDAVATVALVEAVGPIVRGRAPLGLRIGAETLAGVMSGIAVDAGIDAVVLQVDSPGGSAIASETVAHALSVVIGAGKPVVVAMGNTAASGGYWISMGASRIVAQPATLTGSIGVIAGKPVLTELWDELGVNWEVVGTTPHAGMWSINRPFTEEERERVDRLVGDLYEGFKEGVAHGRNLTPDWVETVARGRVWDGATAQSLGLVDRLGGVVEALDETRGLLGLPATAPIEVVKRPRPSSPFERAIELVSRNLELGAGIKAFLVRLAAPGLVALDPPRIR